MTDTDWMAAAACRQHPTPWWTPNYKPSHTTMAFLADICRDCPVRRQCARHAVTGELAGGVYAGVWIPPHNANGRYNSRGIKAAYRQLRQLVVTR